jgi:hypothetical protein
MKGQHHMKTLRLPHAEREERLLLGIVVLYYALTLIGATALQRNL